jgi:hypothetical protein
MDTQATAGRQTMTRLTLLAQKQQSEEAMQEK